MPNSSYQTSSVYEYVKLLDKEDAKMIRMLADKDDEQK